MRISEQTGEEVANISQNRRDQERSLILVRFRAARSCSSLHGNKPQVGGGGGKLFKILLFLDPVSDSFSLSRNLFTRETTKGASPPAAVPFVSRADTHFPLLKLTVSFLNAHLGLRGSVAGYN